MTARNPHPTSARRSWSDVGQCARYLAQKPRDCETQKSQEDWSPHCWQGKFPFPRKVYLRRSFPADMLKDHCEATSDDDLCRTSGYAILFVWIRCPRY